MWRFRRSCFDVSSCGFSKAEVEVSIKKELINSSKAVVDIWILLHRDDDVPAGDVDLASLPLPRGLLTVQLPDQVVTSYRVQRLDL